MSPVNGATLTDFRSLDLVALRPVIERVTRLARQAAGAAHAYVVLVEDDRVWQSGFEGMPEHIAPAANSTTARNMDCLEPVWISDLRVDWPDHPWVLGPTQARGYANAPVVLDERLKLGGLCLFFTEPRERDEAVIATLSDLAALLAHAVERLRAQRRTELAEQTSRAATDLKDAIMQSSPVALGMTDRDLRYVYVNEQWVAEKGIPAQEVIGRTMAELFPASYPLLADSYAACLAGETISTERVLVPSTRRPDRWLRATLCPWRDDAGEVAGLITMSHDVSDVIGALKLAERSKKRLELALEIAEVLVYEMDYRGQTLKVDGAADTFFGGTLTYDDVVEDMWVSVHPDDRAAAKDLGFHGQA